MKKKKKYTQGFSDVEMLFEHLSSEERKARGAEWLKANYSKVARRRKGVDDDKEDVKSSL